MRLFSLLLLFYTSFNPKGAGQPILSLFDTLYPQKNIKISLTYPFDSLYSTKREEIEATISIETQKGFLIKDEAITLNLRGKFRRMKCSMPPLLLNFKKSMLRDLHLTNADEIKLVTHCLETPEGQENLEEERLCYQLYETLTPYAYRTIWLTVEYHDASNIQKMITSSGFLLEPDKVISTRLGLAEKKLYNVAEDSLHFETYGLAAAFNFLIGNRDWSIVMSRNAKLFYQSTMGQYVVIPYDFDYSNIVGASYRRETMPSMINRPYDRLYEGEYYKNQAGEILKILLDSETTLLEKVSTAENPMDEGHRKQIYKYLETWFVQIKKSKPEELKFGMVCTYKGSL